MDMKILLDLKMPRSDPAATDAMAAAVAALFKSNAKLYDRCLVCSFYPAMLR